MPISYTCIVCLKTQHDYPELRLKTMKRYGADICSSCSEANWDGLREEMRERLTQSCLNQKLPPPKLNEDRVFPITDPVVNDGIE